MTYTQALKLAYDRQLFGAQAYSLARSPGETRSSQELFSRFAQAMRELRR